MLLSKNNIALLAGVVFISIPVTMFILWAYANSHAHGYPKNVELYNSYLPGFLRGRFTSIEVSLCCSIIAIFLSVFNLDNPNIWLRTISVLMLAIGILLAGLNLFGLM